MALNPTQQRAVDHRGGPLLVLAGAGTGKTRVITHRVAALLEEGVRPWEILAVTFTNKAAGEMRERIEHMTGETNIRRAGMWVGTFHSICARLLRRHGTGVGLTENFAIYDSDDQRTLMKRVLKDQGVSDRAFTPRGVLGSLDKAKNQGLGRDGLEQVGVVEPVLSVVRRAWEEYERRLRSADAADFGDLLTLSVELLQKARETESDEGSQLAVDDPVVRLRRRFRHVVVDEFQDTNPVQAELVELLSEHAELCVVGDDDQSIYGWRGADVAQILSFPDRHPGCEVVRLEQNYRSTGHILECADAVIRRNTGRLGKKLWSELGDGDPVRVVGHPDERAEASWVASEIRSLIDDGAEPGEVAVFYRTHAQSRALEEACRRHSVRYRVVGGLRFFDRMEVKDLVAYMRLLITPNSDLDLLRIVNKPARRIGAKTVEKLAEYAASSGIALYDALAHGESAGLSRAPAKRVAEFRQLMEGLREASKDLAMNEVASLVLERSGYVEWLAADDSVESESRLENLQEFVGAMAEFAAEQPDAKLAEYLELVSLSSEVEEEVDPADMVTLMTVHSAKGLEYTYVYVTGMEERVFPHARSLDDPDQMEEERRLAYVAVTRAKRRLALTLTARRFIFGDEQVNPPSRFVGDLPSRHVLRRGMETRRRAPVRVQQPKPEPQWNDDIQLDAGSGGPFGEVGQGVELYVGMLWRHKKYGVGELVQWSGAPPHLKLTLRFPGRGTKQFLARFCEPA